jgi:hypothetical protein
MGWGDSVTPRPSFTPVKGPHDTHCTRGLVGPRDGLDRGLKKNPLPLPGPNPSHPVCSQILTWRSYSSYWSRWKYNIKIVWKETRWESVAFTHVAHDRDKWRALKNSHLHDAKFVRASEDPGMRARSSIGFNSEASCDFHYSACMNHLRASPALAIVYTRLNTLDFYTRLEISRIAEWLSACHEGLCSMELFRRIIFRTNHVPVQGVRVIS